MDILLIAGATFIFLLFALYYIPVGIWLTAMVSGVSISLIQLFLMRFRKIPPAVIVRALIEAHKGGVSVDYIQLQVHYLAGGNVENVIHGLVAAKAADLRLSYKRAAAANLAGIDILDAVKKKLDNQDVELKIFD